MCWDSALHVGCAVCVWDDDGWGHLEVDCYLDCWLDYNADYWLLVHMFNILLMQMVRKPSQINHDVKTIWEAMKRSPSSVILPACSFIFVWFVGGLTVVLTKVVLSSSMKKASHPIHWPWILKIIYRKSGIVAIWMPTENYGDMMLWLKCIRLTLTDVILDGDGMWVAGLFFTNMWPSPVSDCGHSAAHRYYQSRVPINNKLRLSVILSLYLP